jgi:DNA-binding MarR family transcriptional regulator
VAGVEHGEGGQRPEPSLIYVIGRVSQGIRRELRARLESCELSVPDVTTLSVLRGNACLSNAQLARRALITPQSMIEVLASLEQRGLVLRRADAANARIMRAELTALGRRALARADAVIAALEDELLAAVSPQRRAIVQRSLLSAMDELSRSGALRAEAAARRSPSAPADGPRRGSPAARSRRASGRA